MCQVLHAEMLRGNLHRQFRLHNCICFRNFYRTENFFVLEISHVPPILPTILRDGSSYVQTSVPSKLGVCGHGNVGVFAVQLS